MNRRHASNATQNKQKLEGFFFSFSFGRKEGEKWGRKHPDWMLYLLCFVIFVNILVRGFVKIGEVERGYEGCSR